MGVRSVHVHEFVGTLHVDDRAVVPTVPKKFVEGLADIGLPDHWIRRLPSQTVDAETQPLAEGRD